MSRNKHPNITDELIQQHAEAIQAEWKEIGVRWLVILEKVIAAEDAGFKRKHMKKLADVIGRDYSTLKKISKIGRDPDLQPFIAKYKSRIIVDHRTVLDELRLLAKHPHALVEFEQTYFNVHGTVAITRDLVREFRRKHGLLPKPKPRDEVRLKVSEEAPNAQEWNRFCELVDEVRQFSFIQLTLSESLEAKIREPRWSIPKHKDVPSQAAHAPARPS